MTIAGVLLAGGQSQRMGGGDKCLRPLGGRSILAHVIERAQPQVATLVLNANGDAARFAAFGLPVVADDIAGFAGPLAGVLAGLDWAATHLPAATHVASFATDAPFLPPVPYRGRPNAPYLIPHTLRAMAAHLGTDASMLAALITSNTEAVYGHWDDEPVDAPPGPFEPH